MSVLERAAQAIIDLDGRHGLAYTEAAAQRLALRYARAVLIAVREPDGDVVGAGVSAWPYDDAPTTRTIRTFTAMIDAILRDHPLKGSGE